MGRRKSGERGVLMTDKKIIKNASTGYGYHYASLADFARQDVNIPQMTTKLIDGVEYVYYKDGDEWLQGARVIVEFESKGMNAAQAYGSALTYARRYTVALANGIATDDDDEIEKAKPVERSGKVDFAEVRAKVATINSIEELARYQASLKLTDTQWSYLKQTFTKRKEELS